MVYFFVIAAAFVAGVAAWTDTRSGHIPNWLTLGALALGLVGHTVVGWRFGDGWHDGLAEGGEALGGALLCSLVPLLMYWRGAIGGGDVKLFAALGALCQPMAGLEVETYSFIAAALIAPAKLAYQGMLFKTLGRSLALVGNAFRRPERRREIPAEVMTWFRLGPAIFLGTAATLLTHWGSLP
jgi:prepilin peptidase CpaA